MKLQLLTPNIKKLKERNSFWGESRSGFDFEFTTGVAYRKFNEDRPSWLGFQVFGFGLGVSWNMTEECW